MTNTPKARPIARKGASRTADIPADVLQALSKGEIASATLTESLALDYMLLLRTAFPNLPAAVLTQAEQACTLGIAKRMRSIGSLLWDALGADGIVQCQQHGSDTVRAWACFMLAAAPAASLEQRLSSMAPLADDSHFGVREWSWLALRPHLAQQLPEAIQALTAWTAHPSEYMRRFASESLRPRGVWCAHINELKQDPALALPILQPLRADGSVYVQDSVANWLNDAAKDQPDWVRALCQQWLSQSNNPATQRIAARAQRSL
ncbi:DNA alkylation repair protein [Lampropedia aestuarii]|uniref:DNA alkylation repair protein n=1 Tax=Lampropedia aestuarii TaxID=2562762 RepID=A0A4S5BHM5_9BURK|nr:HEAT repeat domain-containing protein [Lampropedia aestuarii]THJ31887.1 DNA alkylation repair protein [Lampropedia aestuarii]